MSTASSFPKALQLGLKIPLFLCLAGVFLAMVVSAVPPLKFVMPYVWWMFFAGVAGELIAVPVALFFMSRGEPYATRANRSLTFLASIPLLFAAVVAISLTIGRVHI